MRWRIKEFVFCEQQQTLTSNQETQQLEPMVVELLAYFCRHTDQIISRSQLIETVWLGRVITDNAVSKVVNKLRKILADDAKKPQFIATLPKKGYKFIADVSVIESGEVVKPVRIFAGNKINLRLFLLLFLILTSTLTILMIGELNQRTEPVTQVKALTRAAGRESQPEVSPNGKYLTFIEVREKKIHLWIKSLEDGSSIEIIHNDGHQTWVGPASWNADGSLIAYLVTTPDSCQYFMRSFKDLTVGDAKLIHNCPAGSAGKIAFTHDDNRLIYTESEGFHAPYTLFELNLESGKKRRLAQPEQFLGGNNQFDIHPKLNKLLISSPDKQQWEGFYSLDLDTDKLNLLFKQDAYICCGIWDHSGERVVLMGEHPASQLVSYNLQGGDRRVIYSGSQQVRSPKRHINGKDYLFAAGYVNQNVLYYDFQTQTNTVVANASVDDRLAVFSHFDNQIAYISLSSGSEEIWLTNTNGKTPKKLTHFNDSRHYIELLWSYNGDYILALALNEIHMIDSKTGAVQMLEIPQVEIRGLSWKSDRVIAYSTKQKDGWRVNYYDIKTRQVKPETEIWAFIRYAKNPNDVLWVDTVGNLFFGYDKKIVTENALLEMDVLRGRTFNLKKSGSKWAWQKRIAGKYQLMVKERLNVAPVQALLSDSFHFDLSENGLLYHTVTNLNADIYQSLSD